MQSGGERYGMGQADMQAYAGGGGSGGGGGAGGARGLAHLFGHPQTSSDASGLHTLHLHRPLHQEQQYIDLAQLRGSAPQQAAPSFLHPSQLPSAAGSYHMPSFFKTSQAANLSGQQQTAPDTASHSFFHIAPGHAATHQDQFKLSNFNNHQLHQEEDASASHNLTRSASWLADETAALLKVCSDMDHSTKAPCLWEDVSRKLQDMGYNRSPQKCKEKFESFHKNYKKGKEGGEHAENHRRELEFSSDFSSEGGHASGHVVHEGGHAAHVQTSDAYDNDDDQEDDPDLQDTENFEKTKKRKMGSSSWTPSKSFFQKLSREIMEKQETLHKAFLDTLEKKDRERTMREEAYRQQEAARLNREQEIRAQEVSFAASRDAALIAFLEKVTGQSLSASLPKITTLQSMQGAPPLSSCNTPPNSASGAAASLAAALLQQPGDHHLLHHQSLQDAQDMDNSSDINTKRWPKVEVHALIRLRSGMEPRFREAGPKAHLWQEIAASMACLGFIRSPKRCKEKWENINKYFKKTKDSSKKRPENAKTCPYFHQLDTLYQRGILTSSSSGSGGKLLGKSENLLEYNTQDDEDNYDMQNAENNMQGSDMEGNGGENTKHAEQVQGRDKDLSSEQVSMLDASQSSIFVSGLYTGNAPNASSSGGAPMPLVSLPQQMEKYLHHHHNEGLNMNTASKKSLHVEMFVKDILDLQQQQHQKLVDEYDRMEQAHELRELERQQIKAAAAHPHATPHDNATLMALVHKLAGDSSDLSMSAPSSME